MDLSQYAPGLCEAEDQNASVIVNVDTNDADESGMPIDTSSVPEADMAEGAAAEAVATESAAVADDAADAGDGLEKVEEALNSIASERRGMTKTEAKLIDDLARHATARLYRGAPAKIRSAAILGAGIESIEAGGFAAVVAACEENKKGIMETIKAFIQKVIDFFKGIFNSIKKYISGSAKLKTRATEIKKRAAAAKKTTGEGKISLGDAGVLAIGDNDSVMGVSKGAEVLHSTCEKVLIQGSGLTALSKATHLLSSHWDSSNLDDETKKALAAMGADLKAAIGGGSRESVMLIGGLQLGTIINPEEYKVTAFAKQTSPKEKSGFDVLSKSQAEDFANKAEQLIDVAIKYQESWKARDAVRNEVEKNLKRCADEAGKGYKSNSGEDGMIKKYQTKRRISQSTASNLMGVVATEARLVAHSLKVASKLLDWADKSVKALDSEEKTKEEPKK